MACAVFARGVFVELLAELLPAVDLARFSSTSTRFYSQAAALAFASIRAQHGLMIAGALLSEKALRAARSAELRPAQAWEQESAAQARTKIN
eukprot:2115425-Pyramimonas_sp.AAC.1